MSAADKLDAAVRATLAPRSVHVAEFNCEPPIAMAGSHPTSLATAAGSGAFFWPARTRPIPYFRLPANHQEAGILRVLNAAGQGPSGHKKNVDDTRESPALKLIALFEEAGAKVDYYDPYVPMIPHTRSYPNLANRHSIAWSSKAISDYDLVIIVADHDNVDYHMLVAHARLVVDTRNACEQRGARGENVLKV